MKFLLNLVIAGVMSLGFITQSRAYLGDIVSERFASLSCEEFTDSSNVAPLPLFYDARLLTPEQKLLIALMNKSVQGVQTALRDGATVNSNTKNLVVIAIELRQYDIAALLLRDMVKQGVNLDGPLNYYNADHYNYTFAGQVPLIEDNHNYYETQYRYVNKTLEEFIKNKISRYENNMMKYEYRGNTQVRLTHNEYIRRNRPRLCAVESLKILKKLL